MQDITCATATAIALTQVNSQESGHKRKTSQVKVIERRKSTASSSDSNRTSDMATTPPLGPVAVAGDAPASTNGVQSTADHLLAPQDSPLPETVKPVAHRLVVGVDFGTTYSGSFILSSLTWTYG